MESELWAVRMASKRSLFHSSQYFLDRQLNTDDLEADDDFRTDFSCPYCGEEFDIASMCTHLEDEQCCEAGRITICPVCTVKVGTDVVGHITTQHAYLFKAQSRRRFRRIPRDLTSARLQALLGQPRSSSSSSDSFLSSLVSGFPFSEVEDSAKPVLESLEKSVSFTDEKPQSSPLDDPGLTTEEREQRTKQATSRAQFVQHIVLSTLWPEL